MLSEPTSTWPIRTTMPSDNASISSDKSTPSALSGLIDNPLAEEVTSILDILDFLDILVTAHSFITLSEPKPTPADQDGKVLDYVTSKPGMSQSRDLVSPFDLASLKIRPFRLNRNKTPRSDGIPVEIYQATWSVTARSSPTC